MEPAIKIWGQAPSPFAELPAASNSGCSRWYSLPPRILILHFDYMTELREQLVNERGLLHLRKIVLSQGKLGRPSQLEEVCQKFHHHHLRVFHLCQVFRCAGYKKHVINHFLSSHKRDRMFDQSTRNMPGHSRYNLSFQRVWIKIIFPPHDQGLRSKYTLKNDLFCGSIGTPLFVVLRLGTQGMKDLPWAANKTVGKSWLIKAYTKNFVGIKSDTME